MKKESAFSDETADILSTVFSSLRNVRRIEGTFSVKGKMLSYTAYRIGYTAETIVRIDFREAKKERP